MQNQSLNENPAAHCLYNTPKRGFLRSKLSYIEHFWLTAEWIKHVIFYSLCVCVHMHVSFCHCLLVFNLRNFVNCFVGCEKWHQYQLRSQHSICCPDTMGIWLCNQRSFDVHHHSQCAAYVSPDGAAPLADCVCVVYACIEYCFCGGLATNDKIIFRIEFAFWWSLAAHLNIHRTISDRNDDGSVSWRFWPTSHNVFSTHSVPL